MCGALPPPLLSHTFLGGRALHRIDRSFDSIARETALFPPNTHRAHLLLPPMAPVGALATAPAAAAAAAPAAAAAVAPLPVP